MTSRYYHVASFILILVAAFCYFPTIYGDSAIYFTYLKSFFYAPYVFQPNTVSFGASSPLFVALFAPVYAAGGVLWIPLAKIVSIAMLIVGTVLIIKQHAETPQEHLAVWSLVCLNAPLWFATSALFETGLLVLALGASVYYYHTGKHSSLILLVGLYHLIRPELVIIGIAIHVAIWRLSKYNPRTVAMILLSYLPVALYYGYMFVSTGSLMPSSVAGRAITSMENQSGWVSSFFVTGKQLFLQPVNAIYLIILVALVIYALRASRTNIKRPYLFLSGIFLIPFIINPPLDYAARYLLPVSILLLPVVVESLRTITSERIRAFIVGTAAVMSVGMSAASYSVARRYDIDTLLLKELPAVFTKCGVRDADTVLMYEMQSQYYLPQHLISADGIVGNQFFPFLVSRQSFEEAIKTNHVSYVVTMNSFNYRPIYRTTPLLDLYKHDLASNIGDSVALGSLMAVKVATNQVFADSTLYAIKNTPNLNSGTSLRVYNAGNAAWKGHHPLWNSVYKIVSK